MIRLRRSDLEAILRFVVDVNEIEGVSSGCPKEHDHAYSVQLLARLQELIPCDALSYHEDDHSARDMKHGIGICPDPDRDLAGYWSVGPCPIHRYRHRTGHLPAMRMSEVTSSRRYHETAVFREYFQSVHLDHTLDLGLAVGPACDRSLTLFRRTTARDFSERDRDVLELLRPHLYQFEKVSSMRRALKQAMRERNGRTEDAFYGLLTPREREIVELVGKGNTNAEIAATLWVAPSTVKKHLEHVYAKTGIGRRAAVAAARYAPSA